jgi:hypothetical protein
MTRQQTEYPLNRNNGASNPQHTLASATVDKVQEVADQVVDGAQRVMDQAQVYGTKA